MKAYQISLTRQGQLLTIMHLVRLRGSKQTLKNEFFNMVYQKRESFKKHKHKGQGFQRT